MPSLRQLESDVSLRPYRGTDQEACAVVVDGTWGFGRRFAEPMAGFARDLYLGGSLSVSDCGWVVEDEAGVRGFLLGRCGVGPHFVSAYGGLAGSLRAVARLLRLPGLPLKEKLRWLSAARSHAANRASIEPEADGEVVLFAIDAAARGRGYGRALMDAYLERCRAADTRRIVVETDTASSFGFYDHYGFEPVGSFHSPLNERFIGGAEESFVYQLEP
jgi:ribosomal protein S18 acetylase RimI-like enzyme